MGKRGKYLTKGKNEETSREKGERRDSVLKKKREKVNTKF